MILLAQIVLSFHNKGPSIRTKNVDPLQVLVFAEVLLTSIKLSLAVQSTPGIRRIIKALYQRSCHEVSLVDYLLNHVTKKAFIQFFSAAFKKN